MVKTDQNTNDKDGIEIPVHVADKEDNAPIKTETSDTDTEQVNDQNYLEQLQRLQAEFHNYRRRTERERAETYQLAKGDLILKLLPVLDDFERMNSHHDENDIDHEGIKLIYQKMEKILMDEGLEIVPARGESFDPEYHHAIGVEETDAHSDNRVVEEWQKGYRFKERLLRPSSVKVGKFVKKAGDAE